MAGKRTREDESPKDRYTEESCKEDDDALLNEDEDSLPTQTAVPAASEKPNDTLESTLIKLNDNMLSVTKSMNSMQQAIVRLADNHRPSKRQRVDELSDSDTDSNNEASASLDKDSDTLLENLPKTCPTRELKDDLLDTIANDLNADEQTDQDVSDKLAKIINKRWSEKLNSEKLSEKLKKYARPGTLTV